MPKDTAAPKDTNTDLDAGQADAGAPPAKGTGVSSTKASAKADAGAPPAGAPELEPGTVLKDDGDYEEVVVRRKKAARPTGRYVATANYRCSVDDEKTAKMLEKQGANVSRHRYDKDHELAGQVTFHVLLPAPPDNGPNPSFDLPPDIAEHALAVGAVIEELR